VGGAAALGAAVVLLVLPAPRAAGLVLRMFDVPGTIGGRAYEPALFVDEHTSIGVIRPDRVHRDLVVVQDGAIQRTLRRGASVFNGLTIAGDTIAWLEQPSTADGPALYAAEWRTGAVRELTRDVGDFAFFNSEDDLRIDGGVLRWIAGAPGEAARSELRTVPMTGGRVSTTVIDGAWQLVGAHRLSSVMNGDGAAVLDWPTRKTTRIRTQPTELVSCGEVWCRAIVFGGDGGAVRIDLMYADGSHRTVAVTGSATAPLVDVALLDRWEAYTRMDGGLELYDLADHRLTAVARGAGQVVGRHGFLWWSTGSEPALTWHALNLRRLGS
jgi:hypothetical protein